MSRRLRLARLRLPAIEPLEPRLLLAADWRNPVDSLDVSGDRIVSPIDVLLPINRINSQGAGPLGERPVDSRQPYYDVTGNDRLEPLDVLTVINAINAGRVSPYTLREGAGLATERSVVIGLGQTEGSRTYRFELDARFDTEDQSGPLEDLFAVYIVAVDDPSTRLLASDGADGAVFTLDAGGAEFRPGLVSFDGRFVEIDLTGMGEQREARLLFQLLNHDSDLGSTVTVQPLSNVIDASRPAPPVWPRWGGVQPAGDEVPFDRFLTEDQATLRFENVRFDSRSGTYAADLRVVNSGPRLQRNLGVLFEDLPPNVQLINPSGTVAGEPYVGLQSALGRDGLATDQLSDAVAVQFSNPSQVRFPVRAQLFQGPDNLPPVLDEVGPLSVAAGARLQIDLIATDPDGDSLTYMIQGAADLPPGQLFSDGRLQFTPRPEDEGMYQFQVAVSDGMSVVTQDLTLEVTTDPAGETWLSGQVLNVDEQPLEGVPVAVGDVATTTNEFGEFLLYFGTDPLPSDTLLVHGELLPGSDVYPFIAEKIPLVLEHEVFAGVDNIIPRPIYLPILDVANAVPINPDDDTIVDTAAIPGAQVLIAQGTIQHQDGTPFDGLVHITEVPAERTPAALPPNLLPDLVITIQPGELVFTEPAPLTLPNRAGWAPGLAMDLWSINPHTGQFDIVGLAVVSADGSLVETIEGGIRNSSWHFVTPTLPDGGGGDDGGPGGPGGPGAPNPDDDCDECETEYPGGSSVNAQKGTLSERHDLVPYFSQGQQRGLSLHYDSQRVDTRPIVRLGFEQVSAAIFGVPENVRLTARLVVRRGSFSYQVPGNNLALPGLPTGAHFWDIPDVPSQVDAGLQVDLRGQPSGRYHFTLTRGFTAFSPDTGRYVGIFGDQTDDLLLVNLVDSPFGSGWSLSAWQQIVPNPDGSLLLIDGTGGELLFEPPADGSDQYISPPGDFSTLRKLPDGTYQRATKTGTVHQFNQANLLASTLEPDNRLTRYEYSPDGLMMGIVDPAGLMTQLAYTDGRLASIADPANRQTTFAYDTAGNLVAITDPDGSVRSFGYDDAHRMTSETTARGFVERVRYDHAGRVTEVVQADGGVARYQANLTQGLYRPDETLDPVQSAATLDLGEPSAFYADPNGRVVRNTIDAAGQSIAARDAVGRLPAVQLNERNQVQARTDGRGHTVRYTYDDRGNMLTVSDELSAGVISGFADLFKDPLLFPSGRPSDVVRADVNGDQRDDLVVANGTEFVLDVFLADERGFQPAIAVPLTNSAGFGLINAQGLALADLNGDQQLDIVVVGGDSSNRLAVLLGDGSGGFSEPQLLDSALGPVRVVLADLDNDGTVDAITANSNARSVSVHPGDGSGGFLARTDYNLGQRALDLAVADVDGDDDLDVVASTNFQNTVDDHKLFLLRNDGTGSLAVELIRDQHPANSVVLFDLNRDQRMDILTGGDNGLRWLEGIDQGFAAPVTLASGIAPEGIVVQDVNGDQFADIVTRSIFPSVVSVLLGSQDGTFVRQADLNVAFSAFYSRLTTSDINGDGLPDLVTGATDNYLGMHLNNGDGSFGARSSVPTGDFPTQLDVGDVDGDGELDLLVVNAGARNVSFLLGGGTGQFPERRDLAATGAISPQDAILIDLDGDQDLDLVAADSFQTVSTWLNDGDGNFVKLRDHNAMPFPSTLREVQLLAVDIDNDGDQDVILSHVSDGRIRVFRNDGGGDLSDLLMLDATVVQANIRTLDVGDLTGDGVLDIVTASFDPAGGEALRIFPGDGQGGFGARIDLNLGQQYFRSLVVADLNGDSFADFVANASGRARAFVGDGQGGFMASPPLLPIDDFDLRLRMVDVNADGANDLIGMVTDQGLYLVGLADGTGGFGQPQGFQVGTAVADFLFADFNHDSRRDLAASKSGNDLLEIRLNQLAALTVGPPGTGQRVFTYEPAFNQQTSVVDELGRTTLFEIDPDNGHLLSETRVVGELGGDDDVVTRFTYTATGQLETMTDPLGRVTQFTYDVLGRVTRTVFAVGTPAEADLHLEYDAAGNRSATIDAHGNRTEFQYDGRNRLVEIRHADPDGPGPLAAPVERYAYDAAGNQISWTDALGNVTRYEYDALNRLTRQTDALGGVTEFERDAAGNIILVRDPLNRETRFRYDGRNRLADSTAPDGGRTAFSYDLDNRITAITDPLGNTQRIFYDARGRVIRQADELGAEIQLAYDPVDNLIQTRDQLGNDVVFEFDDLNRVVRMTDPAGNSALMEYDQQGNLIRETDLSGRVSLLEYDERDRLIARTDPLGRTTTLRYDAVGNLEQLIDNAGNATTYLYDALNRATQVTDARGNATEREFDGQGNLVAQTDRQGRRTEYQYDALHRLVGEDWIGADQEYTYQYDAVGNLLDVSGIDSALSFQYDDLNRVVHVDNHASAGAPRVVYDYRYDLLGNLTRIEETIDSIAAAVTQNDYDARRQLTSSRQQGPGIADKQVDVEYDPRGDLVRLRRHLGTTAAPETVLQYDALARVARIEHRQGLNTLAFHHIQYDANGWITRIDDMDGRRDYAFDDARQLTSATSSVGDNAVYAYDATGNRTASNGQSSMYSQGNRLEDDGTFTYQYDDDGNLIRRTRIATNEMREFHWDYRQRLVSVVDRSAAGVEVLRVDYRYDGLDRRIAQAVDSDPTEAEPGKILFYVYDRHTLALEFEDMDGAGPAPTELSRRYFHGPGVDHVWAEESAAHGVTWHLHDHLRTVRDLVDSSGNVLNHIRYDAFGNVVFQSDPARGTTLGLAGREFDESVGLYYYRDRYYDPATGRFLGEDGLGVRPTDPNPFLGMRNDPVGLSDPTGREVIKGKWETISFGQFTFNGIEAVTLEQEELWELWPPRFTVLKLNLLFGTTVRFKIRCEELCDTGQVKNTWYIPPVDIDIGTPITIPIPYKFRIDAGDAILGLITPFAPVVGGSLLVLYRALKVGVYAAKVQKVLIRLSYFGVSASAQAGGEVLKFGINHGGELLNATNYCRVSAPAASVGRDLRDVAFAEMRRIVGDI
ncbi:MAG: VCBS repeat-containing protein [Pirellulaceae bacterium]|nr:VCBS repeat-containing protein [Pirellulaceae bacterium]